MVVVGHRVTQDGLEYLVKGVEDPDISGIWTPRENVDSSVVTAYTRRLRASRCGLVENYLIEGITREIFFRKLSLFGASHCRILKDLISAF